MAGESLDVVVTGTFDTPRERVWREWSDPDEVMRWWGPRGFSSPTCRMNFREGGTTLVCMRSDQGWGALQRLDLPVDRAYGSGRVRPRLRHAKGNKVTPARLGIPG
jgi:uncharacterized protein YndB with AHSA1/START domain